MHRNRVSRNVYKVYLQTIPCCQVTMDIPLFGKVFHTFSDLMAYTKTLLFGQQYLQIIVKVPSLKIIEVSEALGTAKASIVEYILNVCIVPPLHLLLGPCVGPLCSVSHTATHYPSALMA